MMRRASKHQSEINGLFRIVMGGEADSKGYARWTEKKNQKKLLSILMNKPGYTPKKMRSTYIFYCMDERQKIIDEHPEWGIRMVTCELGRRWQIDSKTDSERMRRCRELYKADKALYDEQMKTLRIESIEAKKPRTAYLLFSQKKRLENPRFLITELGEMWTKIKDTVEGRRYHDEISLLRGGGDAPPPPPPPPKTGAESTEL